MVCYTFFMAQNTKIAYIFRGSPASGKGTLTKEFMKKIPGKVAFLELDNFRWGFHWINREVHEVTEKEHLLAYHNFLALLENYCRDGSYAIVIEGPFAWDTDSPHGNMQDILSLLEHYSFRTRLFYLKADYEILWKRNKKRDYVVPEKEFKKLYNLASQKIGESETVVDVGQNSVDKTLEVLAEYIEQ